MEFQNPLSGQTHGVDDQVITMTMAEIQEHEQHVNKLFAEKEQENARLRSRIADLEAEIETAIGLLSPPILGSEVQVVLDGLKKIRGEGRG